MPNPRDVSGLQFGESLWLQIAKILLIRSIFGGQRVQKTSIKPNFLYRRLTALPASCKLNLFMATIIPATKILLIWAMPRPLWA
jgi:hypothetical protein